jgi:hypothetical protein
MASATHTSTLVPLTRLLMYMLLLIATPVSARFVTYLGATLRPELTRTQLAHLKHRGKGLQKLHYHSAHPELLLVRDTLDVERHCADARSQIYRPIPQAPTT